MNNIYLTTKNCVMLAIRDGYYCLNKLFTLVYVNTSVENTNYFFIFSRIEFCKMHTQHVAGCTHNTGCTHNGWLYTQHWLYTQLLVVHTTAGSTHNSWLYTQQLVFHTTAGCTFEIPQLKITQSVNKCATEIILI